MGAVVHFSLGGENEERTVSLTLPESWRVKGTLTSPVREETDLASSLDRGLRNPIGAVPLAEGDYRGKNICVVVDDATRPTPVDRIFPSVLNSLLEGGAERDKITILTANGTHAPMREDAIARRLGNADLKGLRLISHDYRDGENLVKLGIAPSGLPLAISVHVTGADFVLSIGTIEPHIMAGFGGGYKNIVPGCAGLDTISATHLLGPASERFGNIGLLPEDCRVRQRIDEAARIAAPRCFIVNTVLDSSGVPVGLFCGDPLAAHKKGCERARQVWGAPLDSQADILVGCSSPMTHDLCQASKAFSTGMGAVRPGGLVMLLLGCQRGLGDYCVRPTSLPYEEVRSLVRSLGTEGYVETKRAELGEESLPFYENFLTQSNGEALRKADIFVYTPDIPIETMKSFGLFRAFASAEEMIEAALRFHPKADVVLSPSGGVCYPVF